MVDGMYTGQIFPKLRKHACSRSDVVAVAVLDARHAAPASKQRFSVPHCANVQDCVLVRELASYN